MKMKKPIKILAILIAAFLTAFLIIQFLPYGKDISNPPVSAEPDWDSPETRAFAKKACFDCHSNETVWPWYSHVAPVSWMIVQDVEMAREAMNFSEWDRLPGRRSADLVIYMVESGLMPPDRYLMQHPEARLTEAEKAQFIKGLGASLSE
jgi:hypothetical protein